MSTWQGGLARFYYEPENAYGTDQTGNNANTYDVYFDSVTPETSRAPTDFEEINATFPVDHVDYVEGGIIVGASMTFTMRYDGIHTNLQTMAIGSGVTSGASAPYTHTISVADTLSSMSAHIHFPHHDGTTTTQYNDHTFTGMKVASITWSHRAGEPMKCTINWIAEDHAYDTSAEAVGNHSSPVEDLIQWHDMEIESGSDTAIEIERQGQPPVPLFCSEWEITLDNALERRFLIQTGRLSGEPVRQGKRTLTGRVTIDSDSAWREALEAMGATSTTDQTDFDLRFRYEDQADSDLRWEMLVGNCRMSSAPPAVPGTGLLTPTFEFRAHAQTGGENTNDILELVTNTNTNNDGTLNWTDVTHT